MGKTSEKRCKDYFGERLKSLRNEKGISQKVLADELGISKGAVSFYETCQNTPDIEILDAVSKYFNVSYDYLLGRTPNKTTNTELKAVCEYTGLTENSVNTILRAKGTELDWFINTINFVLGYENLDLILNLMYYLNTVSPREDLLYIMSSAELLTREKIPQDLNLPVVNRFIRKEVKMSDIVDKILYDDVCASLREAKKLYSEYRKGADENG